MSSAGSNSVLDTTPSGDDTISGSTITTGSDGVCNTTAAGDDVQAIAVGNGLANQTCVSSGTNTERDTEPSGDDGVSGENIHTGANGICNTTANNTDIAPNTSLITAASLETFLNDNVYCQAVAANFDVTDGGTDEVNWDKNFDQDLDFGPVGWGNEPQEIIDEAKDTNYDYNVFLVKDINGSTMGFSSKNQRYCFVETDGKTATTLKNVIAHELGHAFGNLDDNVPSGDNDNLMAHAEIELKITN